MNLSERYNTKYRFLKSLTNQEKVTVVGHRPVPDYMLNIITRDFGRDPSSLEMIPIGTTVEILILGIKNRRAIGLKSSDGKVKFLLSRYHKLIDEDGKKLI